MANTDLNNAKANKADEFYTTYEDIQAEINYHTASFENKTVLCNCDDPYESNFCLFFLRNFNFLRLKRLICTSYSGSPVAFTQMSLFDEDEEPVTNARGYVLDVRSVPMANGRGVSDDDIARLLQSKRVKKLQGNGDFRSQECIEYLKQADIVVTNAPFSLFREYMAQLVEYGKQFLVIGSINAVKYKEIFPLIKENKLWLGASIHSGDRKFFVPDNYELNASSCGIDDNGRKYIRVKGVRWFTNMEYQQRHESIILYRNYDEESYLKYDNFDAIDVPETSEIPKDYPGLMGVPITFLDKANNPDQFEIIGLSNVNGLLDGVREIGTEWVKKYREHGGTGHITPKMHSLVLYDNEGKPKSIYSRIIIRRKQA